MARQQQFLKYGNVIHLTDMSWVGADEQEEEKSLVSQLCPELDKLNELDRQEVVVRNDKHKMHPTEYRGVLSVIEKKRDTLIKKLEKKGYFDEDDEWERLEQSVNKLSQKEPINPMIARFLRVTLIPIGITTLVIIKVMVFGVG